MQGMAQKKTKTKPFAEIDLEQVRKLATFMYTDEEMACALGVSAKTIQRRKQTDPDFVEALEWGRSNGRRSLRSKQFKTAMDGNVTMQIFLGKNYLGQTDKQDMNLGGQPNNPIQTRDTSKEDEAILKRYFEIQQKKEQTNEDTVH